MIHEREIINMPVDLSTKNDSWWSTLSTNSFWVRFVARWTFVIYFIALLHCKCLEIQLVFLLQFLDITVETLMLKLPNCFCKTVNTFSIRWMSTLWLILFHQIFTFCLLFLFLIKFLLFLSFLLFLFFFFLFLFFLQLDLFLLCLFLCIFDRLEFNFLITNMKHITIFETKSSKL